MFKTRFLRYNFIIVFSSLILIIALYILSVISLRVFYSIILPALFITLGFHIAIYFQFKAEKKHNEEFIGTILMGMGIRLFLLLIFIITSLKFLDINKNSFIFSILIFYIYYLTMEIIYLCIRNK